jgi:hypothetical protein
VGLERAKIGRVSGAARKKPARPELNRDWGASLGIRIGHGPTELGWLREKADAEMVFEKESINRAATRRPVPVYGYGTGISG